MRNSRASNLSRIDTFPVEPWGDYVYPRNLRESKGIRVEVQDLINKGARMEARIKEGIKEIGSRVAARIPEVKSP